MNKYARVAESADARDLKSLGLTAVSVQIRSRAPKILRGIYKNTSLFCYKTTLGNDWGIKKPVFKGFMNNYECSVLTLKKIGECHGECGRENRSPAIQGNQRCMQEGKRTEKAKANKTRRRK